MSKPLRVLNIEDSQRDAELLRRHLSRTGYDLTLACVETAEAMRAALQTAEWDVILCDYSMPQFNALRALAVLKETELDLPFIIISGTVGESVAVEAMRAGAHDYLMKDNLVRLAPTIEREMHEAANRRARRQAEAALRESEDRYRDLVEHSHDLICTHDLEGRILSINQEAARRLGYDSKALLGRDIRDVLLPASRDEFDDYRAKLMSEGIAQGLMSVRTRFGEARVWAYTNTLRTEGITVPLVRGVAHDVTEEIQAQEALKASEAELRALFVAMTDVILVLDAEGRFLKIAPTDPAHLYKPQDDLIGKSLDQVFQKAEADFFLDHIRRALDEGQMHRVEYRVRINEKEVWFDGSVSPMSKDSILWIARDITERKHAEQLIRLQATALQAAANAILMTDNQGTITWANPAFTALTGYALEEVLGQNPRILKSGEHDEAVYKRLWDTILSGEVWRGETINQRKDGSLYFEEQTITPVMNGAGEIINFISIKQDITERKQAEERLQQSDRRFRQLADNINEVFWIVDPNKNEILYVSPAFEEIWGVALETLYEQPDSYLQAVHPEDRRRIQSTRDRHREGARTDDEYRIVRPDGSIRWIHDRAFPIKGEGEGVIRIVGIAENITERKLAQDALRDSEERYRLLFKRNPQPMWVFDLETLAFLEVNEAAIHHYGYSREEFLKMSIMDIRPEEEIPALIRNLTEVTAQHKEAGTWRHKKKDGTIIDVEINSHELAFYDRPAQIVLAYDVTERTFLEEQLRQSQKMEAIGQLAGGIAHDFNNLLTAITGYSELSMKRLRAEDPLLPNLQEIKKAGDRAASLTRQLLAFSRKQVLQPKVLDLNLVVSDLERMLRRLIGEDIELCTVLDPKVGSIKVDPGQIEQIIMNLAVNARDAMPQGGKLTLETRNIFLDDQYARKHIAVTPGPFVMLAVSDSGTGIDPQVQSRIFEPFFTTKGVGKGTGLGLSTVYGIVKQSGGNIWVYSEVGLGTTFKIYLPRTDESLQTYKRDSGPEDFLQGTETVLLAEDEEVVRKLACQVLQVFGYKVLEAADGKSAMLICGDHPAPIHLLITDVIMPGMSGRELANRLTELRPEIKVLFMSGYTDSAIVHQGVLDEGANFIQKPFSTDVLAIKVREVLDAQQGAV